MRDALGYADTDFTKGTTRSKIASNAGRRGIDAEEALELILIEKFGEPFVHTQKRYVRGGKSRYDFFIYAKNYSFGIDIFVTSRKEYIEKNVRHKLRRYAETSKTIPIFFVVSGDHFTSADTAPVEHTLFQTHPNIRLMTLADFIVFISICTALEIPTDFKSIMKQN